MSLLLYMNRQKEIGGRAEKDKKVCPLFLVPINLVLNLIHGLQLTIFTVFTKVPKFLISLPLQIFIFFLPVYRFLLFCCLFCFPLRPKERAPSVQNNILLK